MLHFCPAMCLDNRRLRPVAAPFAVMGLPKRAVFAQKLVFYYQSTLRHCPVITSCYRLSCRATPRWRCMASATSATSGWAECSRPLAAFNGVCRWRAPRVLGRPVPMFRS